MKFTPLESVDKVDTLLAGMPFAENLWIFGLHSTPANTTHVPLKTAMQAVFAYKEFFCRTCRQKNKNAAERRKKTVNIGFSTDRAE